MRDSTKVHRSAGPPARRDFHPLWSYFPKRFAQAPFLVILRKTTTRRGSPIYGLSCSLFIRHYWGNHFHFLFLHLLICLNSVGSLVSLHAKCNNSRKPLIAFNECYEAKLAARTVDWMLSESLVDFMQFMLSTRQWNKSQHWHATTHPAWNLTRAMLAGLGAFIRCRPEEDILPV